MFEPAVAIEGVSKRFGRTLALDNVGFDVRRNELFALLGPNGAGKTTLGHILCTILKPDSGTARINGIDVIKNPLAGRRSLGVVFQEPSLDDRLTLYENLNFHGLIYGVPAAQRRSRIEEMLALVELSEWREHLVRTLSSGMKRRLEIARAFVHDAQILFLDEPTVGMDAQSRDRLWGYVRRLRRERELTVIVTTHYIEEVEGADRVCIIDRGHILANDTPAALKLAHGQELLRVVPARRCDGGGNHGRLCGPLDPQRYRDHPQVERRRFHRIVPRPPRRPPAEIRRREAEPRKRVPVAHRPRAPRSGRGGA